VERVRLPTAGGLVNRVRLPLTVGVLHKLVRLLALVWVEFMRRLIATALTEIMFWCAAVRNLVYKWVRRCLGGVRRRWRRVGVILLIMLVMLVISQRTGAEQRRGGYRQDQVKYFAGVVPAG
ncbi:MAG TPA: hypothetical protein PK231_12830, partial [Acidocella sp.]|nr:hypothetical protein [Acidocella sp.]